jgi:ectoine hydroxylase-related dioxygenase (phytanoyl-CoA dioxygenase family)
MAESVRRLGAEDSLDEITAALREAGAVVVEDFISPDVVTRFNAEIDGHLQSDAPRELVNPRVTAFFGDHTRHVTGVAAKSRTFVDEVLCHPILMAACDAVLLPSCARYQLNLAHVLDRGPGADLQMLHRDELVWVDFPAPHPELQLASIVALQDFSAENGATRLIPGSHRWDRSREAQFDELAVAKMPAGAAVLYLGSTLHAGGPNTTESTRRRGMHLSYTLGWLRTEENHYLSTPPDVARTLPRQAQEMLGYAAHDAILKGGGYLGAVDVADPVQLMAEGKL